MSDREPEAVANVVMNIDGNKGQISQGDRTSSTSTSSSGSSRRSI